MQTTEEIIIDARLLTKIYKSGKSEFKALNDVSLKIRRGDFVALMGPSGSGKSTLMNLLGCLDHLTSGEIYLKGENISSKTDNQLAEIRGSKIGFIFQTFNLIPTLNALRNVALPMVFMGLPKADREKKAMDLLKRVGLENWAKHLPSELSGGQQQRVAIARALANDPSIILADEPTGNLDRKTGEQVMQVLSEINKDGKTIILVTHDPALTKYTNRVFNLLDGEISEDRSKTTEIKERITAEEGQPSKNNPKPRTQDSSKQEYMVRQNEPQVEEIWIYGPEKKKETGYLAKAKKTKMSEQHRKTDAKEWFNGTDEVRYKVNELVRKIDTKKVDKWFEGEKESQSKVHEALNKSNKKKPKHFSWSSVEGG
jgi:putative ABC transport system ATP-binding protein